MENKTDKTAHRLCVATFWTFVGLGALMSYMIG